MVLQASKDNGGITQSDAQDFYSSQPAASKALKKLVSRGLLNENTAPEHIKEKKVYVTTEKSEQMLQIAEEINW